MILRVSKEEAKSLITQSILAGQGIRARKDIPHADVAGWCHNTLDVLQRVFTEGVVWACRSACPHWVFDDEPQTTDTYEELKRQVHDLVRFLHSLLRETSNLPERQESSVPEKVFIVHGRNNCVRDRVRRHLKRLGMKPTILADQANRGVKPLIQKLEDCSDVCSAVVLLTPDDEGRLRNDGQFAFRARQNVIFELGFFMGRLGQEKVHVLIEGEVDLPSDLRGIVHIAMDDLGEWKKQLDRELRVEP